MDYSKRIHKLQNLLQEQSCDGLIVDDPINLYYLTGQNVSCGTIIVHANGAYFLVDNRYYELCKLSSPIPVILADSTNTALIQLFSNECASIQTLGFSSETTTYKAYLDLQASLKAVMDADGIGRKITLVPILNPVKTLRSIKDDDEIKLLKEAGELGSRGYDFILTLLKEGISEEEVAVELEIFWKRHGGKSLAFDPIIAFGPNSSMPHYRAGKTRLKKGDCVLIDIGVNYQHYHSDMTRCVFFGQPHLQILEIYTIVKEAQKVALDLCRPGVLLGDLDKAARDYISVKGYGDKFTHSLGHGVGLEIHEWPNVRSTGMHKDVPMEPGMVITIEPGIYLPGIGGIRIEDTVVITSKGHDNLTNRSVDYL